MGLTKLDKGLKTTWPLGWCIWTFVFTTNVPGLSKRSFISLSSYSYRRGHQKPKYIKRSIRVLC